MKKLITLFGVLLLLSSPLISVSQTYHSVTEVYTDATIQAGDTILVVGYYTNPEVNLFINFYGDWDLDEVMAPHFFLIPEGIDFPPEAWNGGYVMANGIVRFETNPDPYHEADSLIAYLTLLDLYVLIDGEQLDDKPQQSGLDERINDQRDDCDSCKFAILISGGVSARYNHSKYWENLVALYNFKVNNQHYCPHNVFVHYYDGTRRDDRIPQEQVTKADSAHIAQSHEEISRRVAGCTSAGKQATFQKMVTNHGKADGNINLLNNEVLKPADLRDMQQHIIDSCCSLVYDEFLQCYGGYSVDTMSTLDAQNKATIYANSNADHQSGHSPHNRVHPYLVKKIAALTDGEDYEDAVVKAKLAYDQYLRNKIDRAHEMAQHYRNNPELPNAEVQLARWVADSTTRANKICSSRNVTIKPMSRYCQWEKYVVPPGGQLILNFKADTTSSCGNVTVYKQCPATGLISKVKVWNWNVKDSYRYVNGNEQRVINGVDSVSTTFWVHNDDSKFVITSEAKGNIELDESPSNMLLYPGFSFGGWDYSGHEFGEIFNPVYTYNNIDVLDVFLNELPAFMGPEFVQDFEFTFHIESTDEFWTDMELYIEIAHVFHPDTLYIMCDAAENPFIKLPVNEPGIYTAHLGDMTLGKQTGTIMMSAPACMFEFDCWGLRSLYNPLVGMEEPPLAATVSENNYLKTTPNPFDQRFRVHIELPQTGRVKLALYDIMGKEILVLYDQEMLTTKEQIYFDGNSNKGLPLPRGVYILSLTLNGQIIDAVKVVKN